MPGGIAAVMRLTSAEAAHLASTQKEKGGLVARWACVHGTPENESRMDQYKQIGYEQMPESLRRRIGNSELLVTTREIAEARDKEKRAYQKAKAKGYMESPVRLLDEAATKTRHMKPIGHIDDVDFAKRIRYRGRGRKINVPRQKEE